VASVPNGIPEGGNIGTLTYTAVPSTLSKELRLANHGFGVDAAIPALWCGHSWSGCGTPVPTLVKLLSDGLRGRIPLPPAGALRLWPALEASASSALDASASLRVSSIFHADDPMFVASSHGAMCCLLELVADWARRHNAIFHHGRNKTITMLCRNIHATDSGAMPPIYIKAGPSTTLSELLQVSSHKWLGLIWCESLAFQQELNTRIGVANSEFCLLQALLDSGHLPLTFLLELFISKVDSLLRISRWLLIGLPGVTSRLDSLYNSWGKRLLGLRPWRNSAAACG